MGLFRDRGAYKEAKEKIRKAIEDFMAKGRPETVTSDWMRALYETRTDRFLSDNNQIWGTGAIMVPVSFALLAVPIEKDLTSGWAVIIIMIASLAILCMWVLMHENFRAFQDRSMAILTVIEEKYLELDLPGGPKISDLGRGLAWITKAGMIRTLIWLMLVGLALLWAVLIYTQWARLIW